MGVNAVCGGDLSDAQLYELFASLPRNSLVRFWLFQVSIATNFTTHQLDWVTLYPVFVLAASYGQRLIVVLGGQPSGDGDGGHWQDPVLGSTVVSPRRSTIRRRPTDEI